MNCPVCKTPMAVLEFNDVEVDFCVDCGGIWLDAGELDLLFGDRAVTEGFLGAGDTVAARKEKPRRCPICRARMAKRQSARDGPVVFDHCPAGDGLWFDKGELALVLEQGNRAPGGEAVVAWLRDLFAAPPPCDAGLDTSDAAQ